MGVHSTALMCRVFGPSSRDQVSSEGSETDWAEPSLSSYNSTVLQANGFDKVYYAFHLLKTDPYVQVQFIALILIYKLKFQYRTVN